MTDEEAFLCPESPFAVETRPQDNQAETCPSLKTRIATQVSEVIVVLRPERTSPSLSPRPSLEAAFAGDAREGREDMRRTAWQKGRCVWTRGVLRSRDAATVYSMSMGVVETYKGHEDFRGESR